MDKRARGERDGDRVSWFCWPVESSADFCLEVSFYRSASHLLARKNLCRDILASLAIQRQFALVIFGRAAYADGGVAEFAEDLDERLVDGFESILVPSLQQPMASKRTGGGDESVFKRVPANANNAGGELRT